jgi:UDP-N-acetylglucosamine--N-acetylmuramyl-(pentapeptide) pyrophosphoryl-undecaprenol N-acetylglucosamine transferase
MESLLVFTGGGGSGGHTVPIRALHEYFTREIKIGIPDFWYIGSRYGIERTTASDLGLRYFSISTGKLRRYFSLKNAGEPLRILYGFFQAIRILIAGKKTGRRIQVFSTGGYVAVPVVLAAWLLRIPVSIHEQTSRAGLANRFSSLFARRVYISFPASIKYFNKTKITISGYPLRQAFRDDTIAHQTFGAFNLLNSEKPLIFITGGGNGSLLLNRLFERQANKILARYRVIHQVGARYINEAHKNTSPSYLSVGFIGEEFPSIMKAASLVVARAGAGTVSEIITLNKRAVLVPLKIAQKNEQYHNAREAAGRAPVIIARENIIEKVSLYELLMLLEKKNCGCELAADGTLHDITGSTNEVPVPAGYEATKYLGQKIIASLQEPAFKPNPDQ